MMMKLFPFVWSLRIHRTINVDKETWIKRYKNQWIIFHFKAPDISTSWEYFLISFITHLYEMMPMLLHHPWCWSIYYSKWNNIKSKFHHTHVVNHIFCCPFLLSISAIKIVIYVINILNIIHLFIKKMEKKESFYLCYRQ